MRKTKNKYQSRFDGRLEPAREHVVPAHVLEEGVPAHGRRARRAQPLRLRALHEAPDQLPRVVREVGRQH